MKKDYEINGNNRRSAGFQRAHLKTCHAWRTCTLEACGPTVISVCSVISLLLSEAENESEASVREIDPFPGRKNIVILADDLIAEFKFETEGWFTAKEIFDTAAQSNDFVTG